MLLVLTESCSMGCTHCMDRAVPCDRHMTEETLRIVTQEVATVDAPKPGLMAHRKKEDIQLVGQIPLWDENLQPIASHCWLAINSVKDLIQIQESECEYFYEMSDEFEERLCWNVMDPSNYYFDRV